MQLKPITAIIVLLLVVASFLVAGCTSTSNPSPTVTPTSTYTPTSSSNGGEVSTTAFANKMTQHLKDEYGSEIVIVTPFAYKGEVDGHQTFTGVIKDGSAKLKVWNRTITYTLCDNRSEARAVFSQAQNKAKSQGYGRTTDDSDHFWSALQGSGRDLTDTVGSEQVRVTICEPGGLCGYPYYMSFSQYFAVTTEYDTRLE